MYEAAKALHMTRAIVAVGNWTTEGVDHQYGKGHTLTVMHRWMKRLA